MADLDYYGADYGVEEPSRLMEAVRNFGVANWAGALTSLSLTAGMAVWAIDLTMRDVSGVPVIRAMEGPMRVAPKDPGGSVAPFQGLALSDITSGGSAAPAPDQIVLAPPPVSLNAPALAERVAAATPEAAGVEEEADARQANAAAVEVALSEALSDVVETTTAEEQDVRIATLSEVTAPAETDALPADTAALEEPEETALAASIPGIARSARPRQRPAGLRQVASVPTDAPAQEAGVQVASLDAVAPTASSAREVDPSSVAAGTRVVQLGAFDSEAVARSEWDRLEGRFSDYMAGKSRMIQKATSGGRDFWRLRVVGFDDGSDARRFCAELLAKDAACIPVTVR